MKTSAPTEANGRLIRSEPLAGEAVPRQVIHVWIPEYDQGGGGIQEFSRFLIRAIADCLPDARLRVFSKNDDHHPNPEPPARFHRTGQWPAALRSGAFAAKVALSALRERPDLILCTHVHFTPVAAWLKRVIGSRFATVAHGVEVWEVRRPALPRALREADRVFAVSRFTRDRLCAKMPLDPNRTAILPNTFDSRRFVPGSRPRYLMERYRLHPGQPVILTISRLSGEERYKGYDQILRALPVIRKTVPDVRYILGGAGSDRPRMEQLVRSLDLNDAVTFAGFVPGDELCDHYNLCDVFAMPSKGEGFGIVFLEALACGKPVVAGNRDGSRDALLDGSLGILVDPDDVSQLSLSILRILTRDHAGTVLDNPMALRARIVDAYGFARFKEIVAIQLAEMGIIPVNRPTPGS